MTRIQRLAENLCAHCGLRPLATQTRCAVCRDEHNELARIKRAKPCECGGQRINGSRWCATCSHKHAEERWQRELEKLRLRRVLRAETGRCPLCGRVREPGLVFRCERCLAKRRRVAA